MSTIDYWVELALEKKKTDGIDAALEVLNQGLNTFPNEIKLLVLRGQYLYSAEKYQEALGDVNKIVEISTDNEILAWARYTRYVINLHANKAVHALGDLDWMINHFPDQVTEFNYLVRGHLLELTGRFEAAIESLSHFTTNELHLDKERYFYRGRTFIRLSRYEEAIDDFTWILENIPEDKWYGFELIVLNLRALTYFKLGRTDLYNQDMERLKKHNMHSPYISLEEYLDYYPVQKN